MGVPRLGASDPGDGDVVHKGLDHWGDLARSGKGCGWAGKQLDKKRGLCVQGGGRESVGGNEAGFVQRALNATIKDSSLILWSQKGDHSPNADLKVLSP